MAQNFRRGAFFNDAACVHHGNAIRNLRDDSEVVRDEEKRETQFTAQFRKQLEDLRLHGDVERGGGLVCDKDAGIRGERHRDHHALAKAAGKLVRILARAHGRLRDGGAIERCQGSGADFICSRRWLVDPDGFLDLRADAHHGIQGRHRLLENHGDFAAAHRAHFGGRHCEQVFRAAGDGRIARGSCVATH